MLKKIFKSANERYLKKIKKIVNQINEFEPEMQAKSDAELRAMTDLFKLRLNNGETLDDILPQAFATVREAAVRTLHQRPYDVQLIGGIVLHRGQIAEMKTGEGKTLVATLPVYLNALTGKGVHVVTVNDYLASRDAAWMGQVYEFLGLTVGCITADLKPEDRKKAYACDITYGTNSQMGFDYLRDNMVYSRSEKVQRPFNFAIVDEVDSILIDEARTPLIISGAAEDASETYIAVDKLMKGIQPEHYNKDEKHRQITWSESGNIEIENRLREAGLLKDGNLYDVQNIALVHHAEQALRAHFLFQKDVDYIVKDDQVMIVDEFTGRTLKGRRYSDGLHQALEAKEHVTIQSENQTIASITYQNYFRLFPKLAGMTGTAMTEVGEFDSTYHLKAVEIPTNKPLARIDENDEIYASITQKYHAILEEIKKAHALGQPVLVGTTSIEASEELAEYIQKNSSLKFEVLNARNHEREAYIVAQAGTPGAITISTNMAGRGTDIKLGGNVEMRLRTELDGIEDENKIKEITERIEKEVKEAEEKVRSVGGLYIIGTERHENRRIDNQLRGRSGRQGDPGRTKFYLSLEDKLMRIFGSERLKTVLRTFRIPENEPICHIWITKAIAKAQQKVESFYFDARKDVLKYDDVMNDQRKVIYEQRDEIMDTADVNDLIGGMVDEVVWGAIDQYLSKDVSEEEVKSLTTFLSQMYGLKVDLKAGTDVQDIFDEIQKQFNQALSEKFKGFDETVIVSVQKNIVLSVLDTLWKEHLHSLDYVKGSIGLRAYGQRDPLDEYKRESFKLFSAMLDQIRQRTIFVLMRSSIQLASPLSSETKNTEEKIDFSKTKRNDPCPCGSGRKYKHCHGKFE